MEIKREPVSGMTLDLNNVTDKLYLEHGLGYLAIPYTPENLKYAVKAFDVMSQQITQAVATFTQKMAFIEETM